MFPAKIDGGDVVHEDSAEKDTVPIPSTAKEFYLAKMAGVTPTKEKVLFSGYGKYEQKEEGA